MSDTPIILEENKMGKLHLWAREGYEKPRNLTAVEKISAERLDNIITEKAVLRDEHCWQHDCARPALYWAREVQFDMKNGKADPGNFRQVTTADYNGPIPGFCLGHIGTAPAQLAEAVYFSRPEMQWGFKPRRWFVIFTDDTKQGGECMSLDPQQIQPDYIEEFKEADLNG